MMEYHIPANPLVGIEHPCIVHEVPKAIDSLGGSHRVSDIVDVDNEDNEAILYLKPKDPMSVPISSHKSESNDVLLAIKVPRIIGRKRKRHPGSLATTLADGRRRASRGGPSKPQQTHTEVDPATRLLRSCKEHPKRVLMEVVGRVDNTHRFRDLPDYGFASSTGAFAKRFQEKMLSLDYDAIREFDLDKTNPKYPNPQSHNPQCLDTEIIPPPTMSSVMIPFNYLYRQNALAQTIVRDSTAADMPHPARSRRTYAPRILFDTPNIPCEPPANIPRIQDLDRNSQDLIEELNGLFDRRPIWTRRAIVNHLKKPIWKTLFKQVHQYVAYMFRSGPWRESLVKLGIDPRLDPSFRIYQSMFFILDVEPGKVESGRAKKPGHKRGGARRGGARKPSAFGVDELGDKTHIFDGEKVALDSKVWQVCDITDPMLVNILGTTELRSRCHLKSDGWFDNGTWARARLIARTKISALVRGDLVLYLPALETIAQFPDHVDADNRVKTMTSRDDSPNLIELAETLRGSLTTPEPTGRLLEETLLAAANMPENDPRVVEAIQNLEVQQSMANEIGFVSDEGDDAEEEEAEDEDLEEADDENDD